MALNAFARNAMLDYLGSFIGIVSLHTADPGTDGVNEVAGGDPAYARQIVTWGVAADGVLAATNEPEFNVPGATTITHIGFWSSDGLTFYGSADIPDELFNGPGRYTPTSITLTAA